MCVWVCTCVFSSVSEGLLLRGLKRTDLLDGLSPRTTGIMGMDSSLWIHPGGPGEQGDWGRLDMAA